MSLPTVGLLHPGAMGSSVGAAARAGGAEVIWASEERSAATRERASGDGLTEVATLASLVEVSDIVISVCPPPSAQDVASSVAALGFGGTYADLNAIAPASSREVAGIIEAGGGALCRRRNRRPACSEPRYDPTVPVRPWCGERRSAVRRFAPGCLS